MDMDNIAVQHVVNDLTPFSAARFLPSFTEKHDWRTFVELCCLIYT